MPQVDEVMIDEGERLIVKCAADRLGKEMGPLESGVARPGVHGEGDFGAGLGAGRPVAHRECRQRDVRERGATRDIVVDAGAAEQREDGGVGGERCVDRLLEVPDGTGHALAPGVAARS